MDLVKAHGRFIVILLVLGVLLWYADGTLGELGDSLASNQKRATKVYLPSYTRLFKDAKKYGGHPGTTELLRLGGEAKLAEDLESGRAKLLQFETDAHYTLADLDKDADEGDRITRYNTRLSELRAEFGYARSRGWAPRRSPPAASGE